MTLRSLPSLFAATVLIVTGGAAVASAQDARTTYGQGEASCRSFVTAWHHMDSPLLKAYITWLDGYMTARSKLLAQDVKGGQDTDDLLPWLVNFCEGNPRRRFDNAADALMQDLVRKG